MTGYLGFDIGVGMLSTVDKDGFVGIQIDAFGEGKSGVEDYEAHLPLGLYARPLDPEVDPNGEPLAGRASTVMYAHEGGTGHAFPLGDPRAIVKLPKLRKGGVALYAPATGGYILWDGKHEKGDTARAGSLTISVPYGSKSMLLGWDVRFEGKETVKLLHGDGHGIELASDGSVRLFSGDGSTWVQIKNGALVLNGDTQAQGTLSVGDANAAGSVVLFEAFAALIDALDVALSTPVAIGKPITPPKLLSGLAKACKTRALTAS